MNSLRHLSLLLGLLCLCALPGRASSSGIPPRLYRVDVAVYCDNPGGVMAAVQTARMGKTVLLISPNGHPGGLTASGLGYTDIGNPAILGGLSHEFHHRAYLHYQKPEAWTFEKQDRFANKGQGGPALDHKNQLASTFEPKVAEGIFRAMLEEHKVQVVVDRLDRKTIEMSNQRIKQIRLESSGDRVQAGMFIDASYEGDLMALAGVTFTVGREANATYGEHGNGIVGPLGKNQLPKGIDPYVVAGKPESGLLPGVNPDLGGERGEADHRLQAYCYRMVLTSVPENRVAVEKPASYDEKAYELLFRSIEAGQKGSFFKTTMVPNLKTDSNNTGGLSCDYIGMNYGADWNWATLGHAEREALAARHRDWQLGLIWTLQNHPRVPEAIRNSHAPWGLAKDEFTDNGHWPYQLYVREARRMVSDLVMSEAHCRLQKPVEDPVGMGAYTLDSHHTQRIVHNGMVLNEGDIQEHLNGKPYGISYRSLIPRKGECENLLVPWALSASHIAFGSIRMEPVFMILGQSAGTAACLALDAKVSVQELPYPTLRDRLIKDGQIIQTAAPKAKSP